MSFKGLSKDTTLMQIQSGRTLPFSAFSPMRYSQFCCYIPLSSSNAGLLVSHTFPTPFGNVGIEYKQVWSGFLKHPVRVRCHSSLFLS